MPPSLSTPPPVRIIALDLDGTLLAGTGLVSPRNQAALHAARAAGIEIVIATGRRHCYAMRQLRALTDTPHPVLSPNAVLISSNGAVLRTIAADLISRSEMTLASCRRLFSSLGEFRNALVVTFDRVCPAGPGRPAGEDERGALVVEDLAELHASIEKWMIANEPYIERVTPIERSLEAGAPIQMMLCGTIDRMRRAEALLRSLPGVSPIDDPDDDIDTKASHEGIGSNADSTFPALQDDAVPTEIALHRTEYPVRDLSIVDILPAGASKGTALAQLAAARGLTIDNVMAIGDNWNDLPMLHVAGTPVLMGNAPAELLTRARNRGWWITRTNEQDGVAHAIEAAIARAQRLQTPTHELATAAAH